MSVTGDMVDETAQHAAEAAAAHTRMRWRLSESTAEFLLEIVLHNMVGTPAIDELIAKCIMPALSDCPVCGSFLGANIDCDACDAVMEAWHRERARLAAEGEGIRLPGDDEATEDR